MDYLSMSTTNSQRRKLSARALLITMSIVMLLAWGGLLLFTRYVPPQSVPAIAAVFLLLSVALFCTFVPLTYLITRAIFAALGREPRIEYIDMPETLRPKYQYYTRAEIAKLRAHGYDRPLTPLNDAVADYVQNYLTGDRRLGDERLKR